MTAFPQPPDGSSPGGRTSLKRIFAEQYPWVVVGISFLALAVSYGVRGAYSVFFVAFLDEFHQLRGTTAGVFTLSLAVWAAVSPLVGTIVDRYGVRFTFLLGGGFLLAGMAGVALVTEFWHLYLFFGTFVALGMALLDIIPITSFIDQWFGRSKGKAFGLAFSGRGIGHLIVLPFSQYLISTLGWRRCFQVLGVLFFLIICAISVLVRAPGELSKTKAAALGRNEGTPLSAGEILKTLGFWRLFALRVFTSYGIYAVTVHVTAYLVDAGFSKIYAASITGLIGVLGFGGAIFLGYISDTMGRVKSMIIGFLSSMLGVFALLIMHSRPLEWAVLLFLIFFGLGYGARGPVFAALASDLFSGKSLGLIYGLMALGVGIGQAAGPWCAGVLFDWTGNYILAFASVIVSFLLSMGLTWGIAEKPAQRVPAG